jgi:hypothetical protein
MIPKMIITLIIPVITVGTVDKFVILY